MIHGYPFTDYHELSLDFIMKLARESLGLHLETSGKFLKLVNANGDDISKLLVTYADMARVDDEGNTISAFILNAGVDGNAVIFTKGNGEVTTITVPYSVKAEKDMNNNAITSYVHGVNVNGDNLIVTFGDGSTLTVTVPYAIKARDDVNGKALTSYVASVVPVGDKLAIKDGNNNTIAEITVPYAVKALKDSLNNTFISSYISNVTADNATGKISFFAPDGTKLAEITPTVNKAVNDSFNNRIADYVKTIVTNPNSDYMTVTHGTGETDSITIHYATRAYKDTYDNVIGNTYIRSLSIVYDAVEDKHYLVAYNGELSELFRIDLVEFTPELSLDDIQDVNITSPADGDILIYDGNTDTWVNGPVPAVPDALDDLTDVTITTPANGDVLTYDSNADEWVNSPAVPECVNIAIAGANVHDNNAGDK